MKLHLPKLPRLKLPQLKLPKLKLPKLKLPKLKLPKLKLPKLKLPKITGKTRIVVAGLGALLLLGGGFAGWRLAQTKATVAAEKPAPEKPAEAQAAAPAPADQPAEAKKEAAKKEEAKKDEMKKEDAPAASAEAKSTPEPAHEGDHAGGKAEGGKESSKDKPAFAPLPLPPPPSEIQLAIRHLQNNQERVAGGDAAAYAEMPKLLRSVAQKLAAQPPENWARPENAKALVLYLLSGGSSALGRRILALHTFAPGDEAMAKGAIAYLEGVDGPERDYLLTLDPRTMDVTLGAHMAFVQSILLTGPDREAALRKLDLARLLAPGGLVEEAALRRQVGLLAETRDYDKFAELARQYWTRFRASPYAENFLRQFMLAAARVSLSIKLSEWAPLEEFLDSLTPDTRRGLYLTIAQTAAVSANVDLAAMAARKVLDITPEDRPERRRALLYLAAAQVGVADHDASAALLTGVDRDKLTPGDQPLYDAVSLVSARIFRAPDNNFIKPPPGAASAADASMAQAEQSLVNGDVALASVKKSMERKIK